ncbi:MAG TPA: ATP-binding protein, partial [Spirochaetota bacterium]
DISHEKRRENLERILVHEAAKLAGAIQSGIKILKTLKDKNEGVDAINRSFRESADLVDDIQSYHRLIRAENGDLIVESNLVNSSKVLIENVERIKRVNGGESVTIQFQEHIPPIEFLTDRFLLSLVLHNMLKNAIEETPKGGVVHAGVFLLSKTQIRFWVKNNSFILPENQLQIFQRSFSTKGKDRGLGTYIMKLFGERYLKGLVGFTSNLKEGIFFYIDLPIG